MVTPASDIAVPLAGTDAGALHLVIGGRVQGVGFRPFIYRLATALTLRGWVRNRTGQVEIHIQGNNAALQTFARRLFQQAPPLAEPRLISCAPAAVTALQDFSVRASKNTGASEVHVPPDLFTCDDCVAELNDPADRRYRYPFINCTQCGPRYTLIRGLPYDRPATTMAGFSLCRHCRVEYEDQAKRRFHAEPVACPGCGPVLAFHPRGGRTVAGNTAALKACIEALHNGRIVAVKGIGGYHLLCDARSDVAIARLRTRKPRPDKPLAVLFPAPPGEPLGQIRQAVYLSSGEVDLLLSPQRPIVLARARPDGGLSTLIAPGLGEIGVMLPYSPLHHLLLNDFGAPLVATSANLSGEPVLTAATEVEDRLDHVADACLHHDRPIARPADDPVFRVIRGRPRPLRPGRGCAPVEQELPFTLTQPVLAVGGHMKNTIALAWRNRIVVSPHIGDMGNPRSQAVFEQTVHDLQSLYDVRAAAVICDAHPGYATSHWAQRSGLPVHRVLHHYAHAAVAAGADPERTRLVFTWDGVGYGADGTLWGGEALLGRPGDWRRFATLRPFYLPGGERAGREPWRSAAALCWETGRDWPRLPGEASLLHHAWQMRLNTPRTSAAGRLFDAAAALTGVCAVASFEGQGPMLLEAACNDTAEPVSLPLVQNDSGLWITDWEPLLDVLLDTARPLPERAACFHSSLAETMLLQARRARDRHGVIAIGLSGGVFQNRRLTEQACVLMEADGFSVCLPENIPVNDAGLSFGQVIEHGMCGIRLRGG
jgi:hydrogenase maturation protein HypF